VRDVDIVQRDPQQARREAAHQVLGNIHGHLIRARQAARVRREIVRRELQYLAQLMQFRFVSRQ
jgi:hypothetical protein